MSQQRPEIEELIRLVEKKYGERLLTSNDFHQYSAYLLNEFHMNISASTLKRIWLYVQDTCKPRIHTLDVLARYLGFDSFQDFCHHLKTSPAYNSSFFSTYQVSSQELHTGQEVEIGWAPNRYILLRYMGNSDFEVLQSKNSKLMEGDRFRTASFLMEQPLSLPYILRNGEQTSPFIAGRNGGLTLLKVIKNE